jgi:hypothetical protein
MYRVSELRDSMELTLITVAAVFLLLVLSSTIYVWVWVESLPQSIQMGI